MKQVIEILERRIMDEHAQINMLHMSSLVSKQSIINIHERVAEIELAIQVLEDYQKEQ